MVRATPQCELQIINVSQTLDWLYMGHRAGGLGAQLASLDSLDSRFYRGFSQQQTSKSHESDWLEKEQSSYKSEYHLTSTLQVRLADDTERMNLSAEG